MIRDLEKDLFEELEAGSKNISDLVLKLRCNKTKLLGIINKYKTTQLQVDEIGKQKMISLVPHNFEQEHNLLVASMNGTEDFLDKVLLPKLKKKKPIFKNIKRFENGIQYWVNPKAREELNNISLQIDHIMQFSFNLTYNDALGLIPKKFRHQVKEDQKLCIKTMEHYINQLMKLAGKNNEDVIKNHLFHKKRILQKLKF